jgi:hypothetical protein
MLGGENYAVRWSFPVGTLVWVGSGSSKASIFTFRRLIGIGRQTYENIHRTSSVKISFQNDLNFLVGMVLNKELARKLNESASRKLILK